MEKERAMCLDSLVKKSGLEGQKKRQKRSEVL